MKESRQQVRASARKAQKRAGKASAATVTTPPPAVTPGALDDATRTRWRTHALALPDAEVDARARVRALLDESPLVAAFVERRWSAQVDPHTKREVAPGLETAGRRLSRGVSAEIRELTVLTREAHEAWLLGATVEGDDPYARGWFVLSELRAVLEYVFDDGVQDERDASLARVRELHARDGESREDLASALTDYATLARAWSEELDGVGGFDVALVDEATALATRLRVLGDQRTASAAEARGALDLRNRYATLLAERVAEVRAAARFVFRHHPALAREPSSQSERLRSAARRRKAKPVEPPAPPR